MKEYPIRRPVWENIYRGVAHTPDRDNFLLSVTRESLRLAASALRRQCEEDYYANYGAALHEIQYALNVVEPAPSASKE